METLDGSGSTGRLAYLMDWIDPNKWIRSERLGYPTRVIKKFVKPGQHAFQIIKVVINLSKYDMKWAPIIEVDGITQKYQAYQGADSAEGIIPEISDDWYKSPDLAKLAAFERLWPTFCENWEGLEKYYEDLDYYADYYPWAYGHEYNG